MPTRPGHTPPRYPGTAGSATRGRKSRRKSRRAVSPYEPGERGPSGVVAASVRSLAIAASTTARRRRALSFDNGRLPRLLEWLTKTPRRRLPAGAQDRRLEVSRARHRRRGLRRDLARTARAPRRFLTGVGNHCNFLSLIATPSTVAARIPSRYVRVAFEESAVRREAGSRRSFLYAGDSTPG
jgi:hypothetical protein